MNTPAAVGQVADDGDVKGGAFGAGLTTADDFDSDRAGRGIRNCRGIRNMFHVEYPRSRLRHRLAQSQNLDRMRRCVRF